MRHAKILSFSSLGFYKAHFSSTKSTLKFLVCMQRETVTVGMDGALIVFLCESVMCLSLKGVLKRVAFGRCVRGDIREKRWKMPFRKAL